MSCGLPSDDEFCLDEAEGDSEWGSDEELEEYDEEKMEELKRELKELSHS